MNVRGSVMWPKNVRGFDWTSEPMAGPPAEKTRIGYHRWWSDETGRNEVDYYVHPDGSAEIVRKNEDETTSNVFPAGTWEVEYPVTTFGSRGGCWVRALVAEEV